MTTSREPIRFEMLAEHRVAVFCDQLFGKGSREASLELIRSVARRMDEEKMDEAFALFNLDVIVERLLQWREMMPRVKPFYAVKSNNDPVLLQLLADLGCGFDCASKKEIDQIVTSGLASAERVIYANPCKTRSFIKHADQLGVRLMTFDSAQELSKICEHHSEPELVLRISVADPTAQCPLATKFGADPLVEAPLLLQKASQMGVQICGISFHVGSGCRDPTAFERAIAASRRLFDLGTSLGHQMRLLDIGGGFPGHDTTQITFAEIASLVQQSLVEHFPAVGSDCVEIIAEPGRFFASSPVSVCANVIAVTSVPASRVTKQCEDSEGNGQMLYLNDGVYGSFNCILFDHFQPRGRPLFDRPEVESALLPTIVWGQTCDGLDQIEEITQMPMLNTGDWVFYENMGAYTSAAGSNFNGFDMPRTFYAFSEQFWKSLYGLTEERSAKRSAGDNGELNKEGRTKRKLLRTVCQELIGVEKTFEIFQIHAHPSF